MCLVPCENKRDAPRRARPVCADDESFTVPRGSSSDPGLQAAALIPCPAKAGQGTRISFSSGRNESALRQGFAAQNAWDAAALRGKSSRQTPDDESLTVPLGNSSSPDLQAAALIPCPAKAGQGTRISFSSGRSESALRQGFAAQNAWDAAALWGKSSGQTPDGESLTVPLGSS